MNELVSIIIPCFNVEKYISECLDSFIDQTWSNLEIICVDDGSTDRTAEIIDGYCQKDERIRLIKQDNLYAGVARNNGLKQAKGKYVLFFDGDDFCESNMVEELLLSAQKNNSDIAVCDMRHYDNQTGIFIETAGFLRTSYLRDYEDRGYVSWRDIPDYILMFAFSGPPNKLYRKDFLDQTGLQYQDSRRDNDEYFVLLSLVLAERISWVPKKFITYRINNPHSLQGFGDKSIDMDDILSTTRALKDGLMKFDRYDLVQNSFRNQVLMRYVGLLEGQRSLKNYNAVYDVIKDTVFSEFEIDKMQDDEIIAKAEERKAIISYSSEEYLFWKFKKYQGNQALQYIIPWDEIRGFQNIGIYCAGTVGKAYFNQLKDSKVFTLVGWFDTNADKIKNVEFMIQKPDEASPEKIDKMLIAVEERRTYEAIKKALIDRGFDDTQIVWRI